MNGYERIHAAVNLQKSDRTPVAPYIIGFAAKCAGMSQKDIYFNFDSWLAALEKTYETIGLCDSVFPRWPYDVIRLQMLPYRIAGRELDIDDQAQLVEMENMKREDYKTIIKGYKPWFFNHLSKIIGKNASFPFCMPLIIPELMRINRRAARISGIWQSKGVPTGFDSACYPPFDMFSLLRSLEPFFYDLYDCPDMVEAACRASVKDIAAFARMPLRFTKGNKIAIYPMRSSASFISPDTFERFPLPWLKSLVNDFWKDGILSVLHCDGNWTPMLKYFRQFPAKSCIVELDEKTNIFEAKTVLGDHVCLKGNVSTSLLAFGEYDKVMDCCMDLIKEVGRDGGFILSSGCEVPLNAKTENVKAIVKSVGEAAGGI